MDWPTIAQFAMTGATLLLVVITFIIILQTRKWNKRNEMRTLPILRFRWTDKSSPSPLRDLPPRWLRSFVLNAENVGLSPIVGYKIVFAKQGENKYKIERVGFDFSRSLGVGQRQEFYFEVIGEPKAVEEEAPPIQIRTELYDVFFHNIQIDYELVIGQPNENYYTIPTIKSLTVDGKRREIPDF